MSTRVYPIDWREEFEQLAPFLKGNGGVVRVFFPSKRCALPNFLDTLKSEYECKDDNTAWRSIRIDAEVYSVRFLEGVRDEFYRKMQLQIADNDGPSGVLLSILQDATADQIESDISNVFVG